MTTATHAILSPNSESPSTARGRRRRSWPGLVLILLAVAFVAFALPPYLTLDPGRSRIPTPAGVRAYYPLLVAHVVFGSVAMLTCGLQVWPWFRRRYSALHQRVGRVYVFGGVVPASLVGFALGSISPFGPMIRVSNVLLATLWFTVTITGFRMARRDRFVEHRRWMIRSVALTLSVITNRVWAVVWFLALSPQLATTFGGNETLMVQTIAGLSGWMGWVIPLILVEWWLERGTSAADGARAVSVMAPPTATSSAT